MSKCPALEGKSNVTSTEKYPRLVVILIHHPTPGNRSDKDSGGSIYSIKLNIGAYNTISMRGDSKLKELEEELCKIKWDIIGLHNRVGRN